MCARDASPPCLLKVDVSTIACAADRKGLVLVRGDFSWQLNKDVRARDGSMAHLPRKDVAGMGDDTVPVRVVAVVRTRSAC